MTYKKKLPENLNCPLRLTLKIVEPKWKLCLLKQLRDGKSYRPCEIHRLISEAPPRVIDIRLRELVEEGFIAKTVYPELPPRSEYSITPQGLSLMPIVDMMVEWGIENFEKYIHRYRPEHDCC